MWTFMLWPSNTVITACAELGTNIRLAVYCVSISQYMDNTEGGLNGAETVTLLENYINIQYTYLAKDANFDSAGKQTLSVPSLSRYIIEIEASGFITHTLEVTVACTSPDCVLEKMSCLQPFRLDKSEL